MAEKRSLKKSAKLGIAITVISPWNYIKIK
ncbi:hypothetical protein QOZ93_002686 [Hathewaya limosa]|uniref:Uncharacterized protein n=1 Tax=Hathewaya limosa TaxID=1536 RepID=A0ABU0JV02_HATLI|nr:hypothetical protein [Hathewaya limosa]